MLVVCCTWNVATRQPGVGTKQDHLLLDLAPLLRQAWTPPDHGAGAGEEEISTSPVLVAFGLQETLSQARALTCWPEEYVLVPPPHPEQSGLPEPSHHEGHAVDAASRPRERWPTGLDAWIPLMERGVADAFGPGYAVLYASRSVAIAQVILHRLPPHLRLVHALRGAMGSGLAGVYGNKGLSALSLELQNVRNVEDDQGTTYSICFTSAHHTPHEGHAPCRWRGEEMRFLHRHLPLDPVYVAPLARIPASRYLADDPVVLWMGDLNYRLRVGPDGSRSASREHVHALLDTHDVAGLLTHDEFPGFPPFQEARITFPPTYKFHMGPSNAVAPACVELPGRAHTAYSRKRFPAYTDRILFAAPFAPSSSSKKRRGEGACVLSCLAYRSYPDCWWSDHKPVVACFRLAPLPPGQGESRTPRLVDRWSIRRARALRCAAMLWDTLLQDRVSMGVVVLVLALLVVRWVVPWPSPGPSAWLPSRWWAR